MTPYKELLFTKYYLVLPQGHKYRAASDTLSTNWLSKHAKVSYSVVRYFPVLPLFEQPKSKTTYTLKMNQHQEDNRIYKYDIKTRKRG